MSLTKPNEHAEAVIRAFFTPERRKRYITLLHSRRGRVKLRQALAHLHALDRRYTRSVPPDVHEVRAITRLLQQRGAPETCYVLAEDPELDDRCLPLQDALTAIVGRGSGAILSCIPGKLAYYEGEDVGERYLLEATDYCEGGQRHENPGTIS
jgi:hypothetical protein